MADDALGPFPETIRSQSAQIRSCDPDRPIAFHKADHERLIRSRKYETKQFIANLIMT